MTDEEQSRFEAVSKLKVGPYPGGGPPDRIGLELDERAFILEAEQAIEAAGELTHYANDVFERRGVPPDDEFMVLAETVDKQAARFMTLVRRRRS